MNTRTLLELLRRRRLLRRRDRWTRAELEVHQAGALRKLRDFAVERSAFYRDLHRGLERRSLHELPIVTKAMMMESFDAFVTDQVQLPQVEVYLRDHPGELFRDRYRVAATSGSTGLRGVFLSDPAEWMSVDEIVFNEIVPGMRFDRGGRQPDTIARGASECTFVFTRGRL